MNNKPMRIKAFWGVYGCRVHRAGKNLDCGHDTWNETAYRLLSQLEHEGYTGAVEFYGTHAEDLRAEFEKYKAIK
jgi:hypothetical protein